MLRSVIRHLSAEPRAGHCRDGPVILPTIGFDLLYAFVIVGLGRRNLVWINVTTNPTAEGIARQLTEAFPWNESPRYLVRDRDQIFGPVVSAFLESATAYNSRASRPAGLAAARDHRPKSRWTRQARR
jgi:hypothetical protein